MGSVLYVGLRSLEMNPEPAALTAAGVAILLRLLAIRYNWRTRPWTLWKEHGGSVG